MNAEDIKHENESTVTQNFFNIISLPDFDINISNEDGKTILHLACQMGMENLVKILLEQGAHINLKDCFGRTPIMLASFAGHLNIVDLLISYNADINPSDFYGFSIFTLAVYGGCNMLKYLYEKNIDCELKENNYLGYLPLPAIAGSIGNEEIINFIMSKQPEKVNTAIEKSGMTSLMMAVCGGYIRLAKKLLKYGASSSMVSKASFSSIDYARKLSFPLLELKIPELKFDSPTNLLYPDQSQKHPLTPNIYISPMKNISSPKKCLHWFKKSVRVKRSKSLDSKKKCLMSNNDHDKDDVNTLKSIFKIAKLQQYWPIFREQQISFKTFLTMDEEDLCSIGINKLSVRNKLLTLIEHYNHIFYL